MEVTFRTLSCQKYPIETHNKLIKYVDFRLSSDDHVSAKRPMSFLDLDCQSTYVVETDPSLELLYQVTVLIPDEKGLNKALLPSGMIDPYMRPPHNFQMNSKITK